MQTVVDTKEFLNKLELVARVSTKHATLPSLQCVLIVVENNKITLKATNLEVGIQAEIKTIKNEGEGLMAVPAQTLIQIINLNNQPETTLQYEEGVLTVESSGSETQVKCLPFEDFPSLPRVEGEGQVLNGKLFSLGIKTVAFAASQSSIKPELGSVCVLQKKEHSLTFVATDSFRLMEKTVSQKGVVFEDSVLIPQKNALELAKICDSEQDDPVCKTNDNQLVLDFKSGVYITSRLVYGSFPDYEQIIPKEYATHTILLKEDFINSFKKTSIFLNKFFQVGLHVTKKSLTVSAQNGEVGSTTESVRAESEGEELSLNFNQRYVSEALPHFVDDSVGLHLAGIGRPMVIKGVSDTSARYLVMPMNK